MTDYGDAMETTEQAPMKAAVPMPILKRRGAINLYYIAVGALALMVLVLPVVDIWAVFPDVVWNGWLLSIGGLISLIGAQSTTQQGATQ